MNALTADELDALDALLARYRGSFISAALRRYDHEACNAAAALIERIDAVAPRLIIAARREQKMREALENARVVVAEMRVLNYDIYVALPSSLEEIDEALK